MSDYGGDDDFDDFDDDWLYVEDEYTAADDLAEHALPSPPPTTYADEDAVEDFDLFDYFNDIEYASDGYDDGNFQLHDSEAVKTGQKRKRSEGHNQGRKKQKLDKSAEIIRSVARKMEVSPVVWRTRKERGVVPKKMLDENAKSVTLLKDWRTQLADAPSWSNKKSRIAALDTILPDVEALDRAAASDLNTPGEEGDELQDGEDGKDGPPAIDQGMLLAALRANLAEAGGPLANMDEQQLLQFAMRMMSGNDAGDDIAGELADNMLGHGEEEEEDDKDGEPSAEHQAWLAKMRGSAGNAGDEAEASTGKTPISEMKGKPLTPPSSDEKRNLDMMDVDQNEAHDSGVTGVTTVSTRKRKAGSGTGFEIKSIETKKQRVGRSFDAPTAASQARSASAAKSTRPGKGKRS